MPHTGTWDATDGNVEIQGKTDMTWHDSPTCLICLSLSLSWAILESGLLCVQASSGLYFWAFTVAATTVFVYLQQTEKNEC